MKKLCLLALCLLPFWNCSDSSRVNPDEIPRLSAYIHFVPSRYYGVAYREFPSVRTKAIPAGDAGQLVAEIRINGNTVSESFIPDFIQNFLWEIDGKSYVSSAISRTFPDSGIFDIVLKTVDFFNDTLKDTLTLFVNTPIEVFPVLPENGYSANPLDTQGVTIEIRTDGINSWQEAQCVLYLSSDKASVWDFPQDTVSCNGSYRIRGPLITGDSALFKDSSLFFYWAVSAKVSDSENAFDMDSSEIRYFRTALVGSEKSHLVIPIRYKSLAPSISPTGTVLVQSPSRGIIAQASVTRNPETVHLEVSDDDTLQVFIRDSVRSEYGFYASSIYLPKFSYAILDTVVLSDTVPPLRSPKEYRIAHGDSLCFFVYDGGSGISHNSIQVSLGNDTLSRSVRGNTVRFLPACKDSCPLEVKLRDYAGNPASPVLWSIVRHGDSLDILGPFNPEPR